MTDSTSGESGYPAVVLHIEDDESVARAVARLLRLKGYEVISACSGRDAIRVIENGVVPDLILTDYLLPLHTTGDQVVAEIHTLLGFKPPMLILSGEPDLDKIERMRPIADRVFYKPADLQALLQKMESLLSAQI